MAKIRRVRKPNVRCTFHNDNRSYKIEERPMDTHLRKPKTKPYRDK